MRCCRHCDARQPPPVCSSLPEPKRGNFLSRRDGHTACSSTLNAFISIKLNNSYCSIRIRAIHQTNDAQRVAALKLAWKKRFRKILKARETGEPMNGTRCS